MSLIPLAQGPSESASTDCSGRCGSDQPPPFGPNPGVSESGLELIKRIESFEPNVYIDPVGKANNRIRAPAPSRGVIPGRSDPRTGVESSAQ
jgi:hypothetical protein